MTAKLFQHKQQSTTTEMSSSSRSECCGQAAQGQHASVCKVGVVGKTDFYPMPDAIRAMFRCKEKATAYKEASIVIFIAVVLTSHRVGKGQCFSQCSNEHWEIVHRRSVGDETHYQAPVNSATLVCLSNHSFPSTHHRCPKRQQTIRTKRNVAINFMPIWLRNARDERSAPV